MKCSCEQMWGGNASWRAAVSAVRTAPREWLIMIRSSETTWSRFAFSRIVTLCMSIRMRRCMGICSFMQIHLYMWRCINMCTCTGTGTGTGAHTRALARARTYPVSYMHTIGNCIAIGAGARTCTCTDIIRSYVWVCIGIGIYI